MLCTLWDLWFETNLKFIKWMKKEGYVSEEFPSIKEAGLFADGVLRNKMTDFRSFKFQKFWKKEILGKN